MKKRKRILSGLLAALLWLSGCARAEGLLVSLGDSLARGYGLEDKTLRYSALTAKELDMQEINLGADGQMAMETLEAVRENRDLIEQADIILISIGANHILPVLLGRNEDVELRLISFERELDILLLAVAEAAPGGRVVILTFGCPAEAREKAQAVCARLNEIIRTAAENYGFLTAETAQAIYAYEGNCWQGDCWQADGLHPNETGHRLLADSILDVLQDETLRE